MTVRQPRVRDRAGDAGERIRFSPNILPRYARRTKSLEALIPILYLKGISTGDFEEALAALVGKDAPGLSASTIARLKEAWSDEHDRWRKRDLSAKRYVYWWVDGIYLEARLEDQAQCILVIIGATPEGKKELVGFADGVRESAESWRDLLLDLKRRGLSTAPQLAVADGALGFWKALGEIWPTTREQRCWVHKTANVLNKLPKSLHSKAKRALQDIWMAETKKEAVAALDAFADSYAPKYDKAVECLTKDRDALLAFYDFPAAHCGDFPQIRSFVRPRRRRSSVPTAHLAAAARRGGQGWPRLARPPQGLALIGPSTAARSAGSGLERPRGLAATSALRRDWN